MSGRFGAPQSSRGSAGGAIPGGTQGAAAPGTSSENGMGAAAGGGRPGTSDDMPNGPIEGAQGGVAGDDSLVKKLGDPGADMPDGSDSR
ncbi:hypothetical protein [Massilia sp. Se16.2.3]|uniref:hypothetical protein n=1 Tax=Massilia sp. Se16.2.3 TaxID=2709303 RepID=UPI0016004477|nr:hypothetical protein [Massilia sp. Se16.2.3]QNA98184.1 hypothetical protein G4G31_03985 [Massilia sp. Se16.2.3]